MSDFGDKLAEAFKKKKEQTEVVKKDINSYIWKGPKNKDKEQREYKMIDASPEQLKEWYQHCLSMLFSEDSVNPGRYVLLDIVKTQIDKCTAELFLRWLENTYKHDDTRKIYPRNLFYEDIRSTLDKNNPKLTRQQQKELLITNISSGVPEEFSRANVCDLLDGCVDKGGIFNRKHLTLKFILDLGLELTPQEMKELLSNRESNESVLDIIKERLNLKPHMYLHRSPTGLTYSEFRAMVNLRNNKYRSLTTEQLVTLKDKVLLRFIDKIYQQIDQWETIIKELEEVANAKYDISLINGEDRKAEISNQKVDTK